MPLLDTSSTAFVSPPRSMPVGQLDSGRRWPTPAQVLQMRGARGWPEAAKAWARDWVSRAHRAPVLDALAAHAAWGEMFDRDPRYAHCAMSHFIDRRFDAQQRCHALAADLHGAGRAFGPAVSSRIARHEQVRLWSLDEHTHLCLGRNDVSYHEGLWALSLRDDRDARLYYLSFHFRNPASILVPTLQGPALGYGTAAQGDARDVVRRLTKTAEGLRPPALLMTALRTLAAAWQVPALAGIAPAHHIKGRWNLRGKRLRFDYASFWQEQGGQPAAAGHWDLPIEQPARDLQQVPSNKRAMYRRREAMLAAMRASIIQSLR